MFSSFGGASVCMLVFPFWLVVLWLLGQGRKMEDGGMRLATAFPWDRLLPAAKSDMHLSDVQREKLCEMTSFAYVEIRQLSAAGRLTQACDLATVFHSLLGDLWGEEFD